MKQFALFATLIVVNFGIFSSDQNSLVPHGDTQAMSLSNEKETEDKKQKEAVSEILVDIPWYAKISGTTLGCYATTQMAARMLLANEEDEKMIKHTIADIQNIDAVNAQLTLFYYDKSKKYATLLSLALDREKSLIVKSLLDAQADANKRPHSDGIYPIQQAAARDDYFSVSWLLQAGASVDRWKWPNNQDPRTDACFHGNDGMITLLDLKTGYFYKSNTRPFMVFAHSKHAANPTQKQLKCLQDLWLWGLDLDKARKACKNKCSVLPEGDASSCHVHRLANILETTVIRPNYTDTKQSMIPNNE